MSGTTKDTIEEISGINEDEEPLSEPLMLTINCNMEETSQSSAKICQSNGSCANVTKSNLIEIIILSDDEPDPISLYEPIGMVETSGLPPRGATGFETEAKQNCEENIVSPKSIRTRQKRKSSDKMDEPVRAIKKSCVSSNKPLKNEGKSAGLMSKREIQNFVKRESRKALPDFSRLSEAMNITYDQRKALYDKGEFQVEMLKKKHPELLHYNMVKEEIGRILSDTTKMDKLEKELENEILPAALKEKRKMAFLPKRRHFLWEKTIKLWEENKESVNSLLYRKVLGMLAVCFEFAENAVVNRLCKVIKQNQTLESKDTEKMATPTIVISESDLFNISEESEIWIYVDGVKYLKVPNMYEAVLSVFATYYIFNINYDSKLKSLFEFFDYLCDNQQTTYTNTMNIGCGKNSTTKTEIYALKDVISENFNILNGTSSLLKSIKETSNQFCQQVVDLMTFLSEYGMVILFGFYLRYYYTQRYKVDFLHHTAPKLQINRVILSENMLKTC